MWCFIRTLLCEFYVVMTTPYVTICMCQIRNKRLCAKPEIFGGLDGPVVRFQVWVAERLAVRGSTPVCLTTRKYVGPERK